MKLILLVTILIFVAALAEKPYIGFKSRPKFSSHVVGGADANKKEFPYHVSLQWGLTLSKLKHFCGGAIINKNWILTAGHCVLFVPRYGRFIVKAGKYLIHSTEISEQSIDVDKIIVHESYTGNFSGHNIALLKLQTPLFFNAAVSSVNLPKSGTPPISYITHTFSGWGSVSTASAREMADKLQKANSKLLDSCDEELKKLTGSSHLRNTNICTKSINDIDFCNGDSGGPLVSKNSFGLLVLVGIATWGVVPCDTPGAPTVYTKVSAFTEWIETNINNN